MVGPLVKLAEVRGAELDRKGEGMKELEGKAAGGRASILYLARNGFSKQSLDHSPRVVRWL
jgi:hypothetical protein